VNDEFEKNMEASRWEAVVSSLKILHDGLSGWTEKNIEKPLS
jgi:hypothetical protein